MFKDSSGLRTESSGSTRSFSLPFWPGFRDPATVLTGEEASGRLGSSKWEKGRGEWAREVWGSRSLIPSLSGPGVEAELQWTQGPFFCR